MADRAVSGVQKLVKYERIWILDSSRLHKVKGSCVSVGSKTECGSLLMYAAENSGYHFLRQGIIQDMTERVSLLKWFHKTSLTCGIQMCGTLTWCERGLTVS